MFLERLTYFLQGFSFMFFLFASLLILCSKSRTRLETILGYVMLIFAFGEVKDVLHLVPAIFESTYWMTLLFTIDMWLVGICAVFIFETLIPNKVTMKRILSVMAVFLAFTVAYAVTGSMTVLYVEMGFVALLSMCVVTIMFRTLRCFNRYLENNYSNLENISLNWFLAVIGVWIVCLILWALCYVYRANLIYIVYYTVSLVGWGLLFVFTRRQVEVKMEDPAELTGEVVPADEAAGSMETTDGEPDANAVPKTVIRREMLDKLMSEEQLYLNPRLTLNDLALALGTNRTYLSAYLNHELEMSFYDFVNSFRIDKACRISDENPGMGVAEIAERSGFNSVSTFRRAFFRERGFSFGEYRRGQSHDA